MRFIQVALAQESSANKRVGGSIPGSSSLPVKVSLAKILNLELLTMHSLEWEC